MGLLNIKTDQQIKVSKKNVINGREVGNLVPNPLTNYEVEIDLDTAKVIPTNNTRKPRKSRLAESSPDLVFCTKVSDLDRAIIILEEIEEVWSEYKQNVAKLWSKRLRKAIKLLKKEMSEE